MEPVDLVERLRVRSTAEELVVDYSPTGRRTPSWPKLSPRRSRHRAGIFSADRRGLFCGAPQDRADRVDRTAAPFWLQQGKNSSSPSSTARDGGGQKELSSFKDGRRKNSGGQCMNTRCILHLRDTSSLSREEDLVSTHLRRQLQKTHSTRRLTISNRGGATALIGSRRDNPGESSFLHRLRGTERSRSPSRHPIVNGRWWR
ncbi:unnamed protein product [Musa acuminata subsp. burmannicoides]